MSKFNFQTVKLEEITTKVGIANIFFGFRKQMKIQIPPEIKITMELGESEYFTENLGNGVKLEMVHIPAGSFMMGGPDGEDDKPYHLVNLPSFYMSKYTITQEQYQSILGVNPSTFKGTDLPVGCIFWHDAIVFCQELSYRTSKNYTLPSESQWEYACRAGTNTHYCFGQIMTGYVAHYYDYLFMKEKPLAVGSFLPNAFGLYDMHGNVWEWCLDLWHPDYIGAPINGSAWVDYDCFPTGYGYPPRIIRGGSFRNTADFCLSASRLKNQYRGEHIGFRLVLNVK
jgi:formylglycine-generating enzyme required for sulfatase activity